MTTGSLIRRPAAAAALALGVMAAPGCTDWAGYDVDVAAGKVPQLATMRRSVIPDPYEMVRLPPEGSVPVASPMGDLPAPFTQLQLDSVGAVLRSPLEPTQQVLERGRLMYAQNCSVCHGPQGAGNGTVVAPTKFPYAPAINGAPTRARSDGYLYGVVAVGRGLMPPYGERLTHADRWAVVHYLRQLQGNPTPPATLMPQESGVPVSPDSAAGNPANAAAAQPGAPTPSITPNPSAPQPAAPDTGAAGQPRL